MTILDNVTFDDIYNKIMLVLVANEGILYNQYKLYSLILNKFTRNETYFVPPEFKYKFFVTLRQLMLKDDNIKVFKENNIYQVIYNGSKEVKPEFVNYSPEWIDKSQLNKFIINNNIDLNYQDPESGNTIYHDILSENNYENVKKLLETNNVNYNIKNNYNKTPIDCIKDIQIATVIINDLSNKINQFDEKLNQFEEKLKILENKNEIVDCSIIKFIQIKAYYLFARNWIIIFIIFIIFISILFYN
jgi:hypothetical protein